MSQAADMGNISNDSSYSVPPAGYISQSQHNLEDEMKWKCRLDDSKNSVDNVSQARDMHNINKNQGPNGISSQKQKFTIREISPEWGLASETTKQGGPAGISFEENLGLTISQKLKFTIRMIAPSWGYASEETEVVIIGSFLCSPLENTWTCMFGDVEVPAQIIQDGVMCCHAPPHLPGEVAFCVTSSNRESCSEVIEFSYR